MGGIERRIRTEYGDAYWDKHKGTILSRTKARQASKPTQQTASSRRSYRRIQERMAEERAAVAEEIPREEAEAEIPDIRQAEREEDMRDHPEHYTFSEVSEVFGRSEAERIYRRKGYDPARWDGENMSEEEDEDDEEEDDEEDEDEE